MNKVAHGDFGYTGEGFVNLPITSNIAARVVGWYRRDGGYIDNIAGERHMTDVRYRGSPNQEHADLDNDDLPRTITTTSPPTAPAPR